jgi:hypothetical protein
MSGTGQRKLGEACIWAILYPRPFSFNELSKYCLIEFYIYVEKKTINILSSNFLNFISFYSRHTHFICQLFVWTRCKLLHIDLHLLLQNSSQNYSFKSSIYIQHIAKISPLRIFTIYWMISSKTVFEF